MGKRKRFAENCRHPSASTRSPLPRLRWRRLLQLHLHSPPIVVDDSGSGPAFFDCKDPRAVCFGEESSSFSDGYGDSDAYDDESTSYSFVRGDWTDQDGSDAYNDDSIPPAYVYIPSNQTGPLPTVAIAYEVGTMTEVNVSATAHDTRPGSSGGDVGCGETGGDGCAAIKAHDVIISEIESRWSCATMLVPDEGPCQIEFSFADPQDIVDIQVAFWEGNERTRTVDIFIDGELTHTHESYADSTFNTLGVTATEASTVMLGSVDLLSDEWISLLEATDCPRRLVAQLENSNKPMSKQAASYGFAPVKH